MALTRTGSITTFTTGSNTGETATFTIPANATLAVVIVGGYDDSTANFFANSMTIAGEAMTVAKDAGASAGPYQATAWIKTNPTVGASKTVVWDFAGTGATGAVGFIAFYAGADTTSPVRDSDAVQEADASQTSKALTCVTGDILVGFGVNYSYEGAITAAWTNATEQSTANNSGAQYGGCMPKTQAPLAIQR